MSESNEAIPPVSRRRLLQTGAAGLAALNVASRAEARSTEGEPGTRGSAKRLIFILCTGGPSQLDTWDPKPNAPREIRGPYRAIGTAVDGLQFSETLPRLARLADRFAVVRSVHSDFPAIHEAGLQAAQTGRFVPQGDSWPHYGAVLASQAPGPGFTPAFVTLPRPLLDTGLAGCRGESAGLLGSAFAPTHTLGMPGEDRVAFAPMGSMQASASSTFCAVSEGQPSSQDGTSLDLSREPGKLRGRYGRHAFGQSLLTARRLVEAGTRCVVVNQFDTLFHQHTWDCHGYPDLPTRVSDLRDQVAAPFDQGVSALLEDLQERGLYEDTLVCCFGEFGRTPQITETGGRDHHTGCWSVMLGGGGIRGGTVIGASDAHAAAPSERPVTPAMLAATVYRALGVSLEAPMVGADGKRVPLLPAGAAPIHELLSVR